MVIRISNGGHNMPAFAGTLKPEELDALVAFLKTRKAPAPR
jgi:mono/diheme cytochrome c family protein